MGDSFVSTYNKAGSLCIDWTIGSAIATAATWLPIRSSLPCNAVNNRNVVRLDAGEFFVTFNKALSETLTETNNGHYFSGVYRV